MRYLISLVAVATLLISVQPAKVSADEVADFYKGKTLTFYVGSRAGGTYGLYTRLLGAHIGKHLPGNPKFIYKFDDGTGGLIAANYMSQAAPRDGTYIGTTQQSVPVSQVINPGVGKFDVRKWSLLGSMTPSRNLFGIWKATAPATTIDGMKQKELRIAATGKTSPTYIHPTLMNQFLGTKFKVITGYKFGRAHLAMEQGEVHGINSSYTSFRVRFPQYISGNKVTWLVQVGLSKEPDLPNVPLLRDLIKDPVHKQVMDLVSISNEFGRFYYLPPGVPKDRVAAWRKAFAATLKDPALLVEAKKRKVPIEFVPHTRLEQLLDQLHSAPKNVLTVAQKAMARKK